MFSNTNDLAFLLLKSSEFSRSAATDNLIKSSAPNANELCTEKLDFERVMNKLAGTEKLDRNLTSEDVNKLIKSSTDTVKVSESVRSATVDFSQAALMNLAMQKLLRHSFKQIRVPIEQAKFQ